MVNGIIKAIMYYAAGIGIAAAIYSIYGHPYPHAPGLHHIVVLLTFIGGFIWTVNQTYTYFSGSKTADRKGILLANGAALMAFILMIVYLIVSEV